MKISRYRIACTAAVVAFNVALSCAPANAALDMVIGARSVVSNKPFSDCSARAKSALSTVMQNANEAGSGSGEWVGVARLEGSISASAVIECHGLDNGYTASFTCAVQVPPNPDSASALCTKLTTAFGAGTTAVTGGASWE